MLPLPQTPRCWEYSLQLHISNKKTLQLGNFENTLSILNLYFSLKEFLNRHHSSIQPFTHSLDEYLQSTQHMSMILLVQRKKVFIPQNFDNSQVIISATFSTVSFNRVHEQNLPFSHHKNKYSGDTPCKSCSR
jgi:hypothetical protein